MSFLKCVEKTKTYFSNFNQLVLTLREYLYSMKLFEAILVMDSLYFNTPQGFMLRTCLQKCYLLEHVWGLSHYRNSLSFPRGLDTLFNIFCPQHAEKRAINCKFSTVWSLLWSPPSTTKKVPVAKQH